jgi:hypothetical protein
LNGEIIKPDFKFVEKDGVLTYPGLRYGQSCDIIFNIKGKKVKDDTKLKVSLACVHKGRLLCPDVRHIEIKKCHTNETVDHVLRFKTIGLFEIILSQFQLKGVEDLEKMTL